VYNNSNQQQSYYLISIFRCKPKFLGSGGSMVASSLRKGKEDRTFRRKSKVRYRSGTEGSEGKTVHSDVSRRFGTNPQQRTVVRSARANTTKRPGTSGVLSFFPELSVGREDRTFRRSRRFGTNLASSEGMRLNSQ